jgi:metallo-beta-lactamase class B VIM
MLLLLSNSSIADNLKNKELEITKLEEGVWLHTSYYIYPNGLVFPSNGLIIKNGQELTLIDTAWGELQTVELLNIIQSKIKLPVTKAIVTHAHSDRAAGVDVLESAGIEVFAHPLTKRLTIEQGAPVPNNILQGIDVPDSSINFGSFEVIFPGAAHSLDNLMIWLPKQHILFGGCAVRSLGSKSAGNTAHGDIQSWLKVIQQAKKQYEHAKIVVPGHGKTGGVELLNHTEVIVMDAINSK